MRQLMLIFLVDLILELSSLLIVYQIDDLYS